MSKQVRIRVALSKGAGQKVFSTLGSRVVEWLHPEKGTIILYGGGLEMRHLELLRQAGVDATLVEGEG